MAFKTKSQQTEFTPVVGNALGISDGDNIEEISGKLTSIFDVRQAGKSTVQNAVLETEHGPIKLSIWGTELPKSLKGKQVNILATNKKFGDVTYKIAEYDGKKGHVTEETLNVGNNADIEEADGESRPSSPASTAPTQRTHVEKTSGFTLMEAAESLATQHLLVNDIVRATYAKKGYDEETLRSYVSTVWIGLDRAAMIVIGQPLTDATQSRQEARGDLGDKKEGKAPTPEYNPQNWAVAVIPSGKNKGKTLASIGNKAIQAMEEYRVEKGYETPFWLCVKQAAIDLDFNPDAAREKEPEDDIPL